MDGSRFAAWTRRRLGLTVSGILAARFGVSFVEDAAAKNRKRHRRHKRSCEPLGTSCNPNNDRRLCCGNFVCLAVPELGGTHCCRERYAACTANSECCGQLLCLGDVNRYCEVPT
jgi:hypothetical protein